LLAELGRTEHITETAEILGLPQSTVSRAIARASAIVGTDLVIRDGRGVRLTPAAKALLPHIDAALAEFQTGLDVVRHESDVVRGRIAVSFQHTFGEAMLPLLISAFRSRHPQTAFDLSQGARDGCLAELAAGSADLALTAPVATPGRSIGSAALYREPLRLVVNHQHPLARRLRARVADIRHEPFVAMGTGYGAGDGGPGWVEIPLDSALAFREIGLAWRERRGGADAEPDPVRLFRELVLRDGPALLAGFVRERSGS
jgi:DNA-binding transcriptional LysR family regulator